MTDSPRVLVADPHPTTRASLRRLLVRHGFEVCAEVTDAGAAGKEAMRHRPDICLVDVLLAGDGVVAVKEITSRAPEIAVVVLTASGERERFLDAVRAGAAGYMLKDIDPERLSRALRGVLAGEPAIPRALVAPLLDEVRSQGHSQTVVARSGRAELSRRECDVARLLVENLGTAEIAERLQVSPVTIRRHVSAIIAKLGVADREAAIALLARHGV